MQNILHRVCLECESIVLPVEMSARGTYCSSKVATVVFNFTPKKYFLNIVIVVQCKIQSSLT